MPYPILEVIRANRHIVIGWYIRTSVHMHKRFAITHAIVQGGQCPGRCVSRFHQRSSRIRGTAETNEDTCRIEKIRQIKYRKMISSNIRTYTGKLGAGRSREWYIRILIICTDIGRAQKIAVILHVIRQVTALIFILLAHLHI